MPYLYSNYNSAGLVLNACLCFPHRQALSNKIPAYFSKSANSINKNLGSTSNNTYKIKTSKKTYF